MKTVAGLLLPLYCAGMLILFAVLSHYPWPPAKEEKEQKAQEEINQLIFTSAPDFKAISDIPQRKEAFFNYLRPMIVAQNRRLMEKREQITAFQQKLAQGKSLSRQERSALMTMAHNFGLENGDEEDVLQALLLRVNVIPEAMALAQAASESAWGTSRFAQKGNNYFGQWCYKLGCGLVPNRRPEGASHEVARFASPYDSVKAYFRNINTHSAYEELRVLRQELTSADTLPTAVELIQGLSRYSERGLDYIEDLKAIIQYNDLESDHAPKVNTTEME